MSLIHPSTCSKLSEDATTVRGTLADLARTRRHHPCINKMDTGDAATYNLPLPLTHSTHTYSHPLCQNSHPHLPTEIPLYEYHTPHSIMGGNDEATHQKRNTHITRACPAPFKLTSPLLHYVIILTENSSLLAAQSLYPYQIIATAKTGETRRTEDDRDYSRPSTSTKTTESPLQCCQSASRQGNVPLRIYNRSNYREGSTQKNVTILNYHSSTLTILRPPKVHMLLYNKIKMEPTRWLPRVKLSPHQCCEHQTARTLGNPHTHPHSAALCNTCNGGATRSPCCIPHAHRREHRDNYTDRKYNNIQQHRLRTRRPAPLTGPEDGPTHHSSNRPA